MTKILLIEDDSFLVDIYTTKFKQAGFQISVVEQGSEAFESIQKAPPDVILLDVVLPHIDGWDILKKLQEQETTRDIPVFVLSNLGQKEEIEKGLRLGAKKYLIKAHYTPSEIIEEIEQFFKEYKNK